MGKKVKYTILGLLCSVMVGVIGYEFWNGIFPYDEEEAKLAEFRKERAEKRAKYYAEKEREKGVSKQDAPEEIAKEFPSDMSEYAVQDALHKMSHQKIKAEDGKKWGALQLTSERVDRLIEVVQANEYKYESLYIKILNKWKESDFSSAHLDHNVIWELQGGTVGKATGVLSESEEQKFIEQHFE